MKIKVLGNTIFLRPVPTEKKKSAIILPDGSTTEDKGTSQIAFAGVDCVKVKVGDIVVTPNFGFTPTILEGVVYLVGNENNVYAIVEK